MSSPAKRKQNRLARRRAAKQKDAIAYRKKSGWDLHIYRSGVQLHCGDLKDVTPAIRIAAPSEAHTDP